MGQAHRLFFLFCSASLTSLLVAYNQKSMGSLEAPLTAENNGSTTPAPTSNGGDQKPSVSTNGVSAPLAAMAQESEASRKRKASMLPLEVGTRVMCRWRDGKYHPVKVIERRKTNYGGPNDYEYYVHYTECKFLQSFSFLF